MGYAMKMVIFAFTGAIVVLSLGGCATEDEKRIEELRSMPKLWKSEILAANPNMPDLQFLVPLENSYDPGFEEFMTGPEETPDYIPEVALAGATKEFRNKPREITLRFGDTVDILAERPGNTNFPIFLVRTQHDTYAWIMAYHLKDRDGKRMGALD